MVLLNTEERMPNTNLEKNDKGGYKEIRFELRKVRGKSQVDTGNKTGSWQKE